MVPEIISHLALSTELTSVGLRRSALTGRNGLASLAHKCSQALVVEITGPELVSQQRLQTFSAFKCSQQCLGVRSLVALPQGI